MTHDLGEQSLTLLEQGKRSAAKAALDAVEGDNAVQAEALTTGEVEVSLDTTITKTPKGFGWLKGGTFTTFAKTKVQNIKEAVGGVRIRKTFGGSK